MTIFVGRYLFHVHTPYTDGEISVAGYFDHARRLGFDHIIFLEHIRREPKYDVAAFAEEVRRTSHERGIRATLGFEAKLLPAGRLDISDEHIAIAEVVGIAEHSFPDDFALLRTAFETVVTDLTVQSNVRACLGTPRVVVAPSQAHGSPCSRVYPDAGPGGGARHPDRAQPPLRVAA